MNYKFSDKVTGLQASAIREILKFTALPDVISFAAGNPAPEAFPSEQIAEISRKIMTENPIAALQYSISEGYPKLRETLKKRLIAQGVMNPEKDDLIITSGGQQAAELSCKVMLNEHDTLICEAPSFTGCLTSFKSYNVNLVGVPLLDDGMDIEKLKDTLKSANSPKLIYVIPNFQNPTGICTSEEKRRKILDLAKRFDCMILEDNPYGDIRFSGETIPSVKSFDDGENVIYAGSFSKVIAPGLRVGYVCAPKEVISKITVCKQVSDVHTNIFAQMICDEFVNNYDFEGHLKKIREIYRKKCSLMIEELEKNVPDSVKFTHPEGGLFLWGTLPDGVDMKGFCKAAVEKKVAVVPGVAFMTSETLPTQSFRLNFSTPRDEQIIKGCKILGDVSREFIR
ncbi:MAG: PLP-dependent aminotransferase family protein [Ruminococcus sp.]|jgi:2-aminoadipate transaminase|nr:PLP-dependent aminotransferase family protein [Ruminococcus sp.]